MSTTFYVSVKEDKKSHPSRIDLDREEPISIGTRYLPRFFQCLGEYVRYRDARLVLTVELNNATEEIVLAIRDMYCFILDQMPYFDLEVRTKHFKIDSLLLSKSLVRDCGVFNRELLIGWHNPYRYFRDDEFVYQDVPDSPNLKAVVAEFGVNGFVSKDFQLTVPHGFPRSIGTEISFAGNFVIEDQQDYQTIRKFFTTHQVPRDDHNLLCC